MFADRLRIGRLGDRQHFFQQVDHFLEWREAHLVSRYSNSGLVRAPCSQTVVGRNVRGPSV